MAFSGSKGVFLEVNRNRTPQRFSFSKWHLSQVTQHGGYVRTAVKTYLSISTSKILGKTSMYLRRHEFFLVQRLGP